MTDMWRELEALDKPDILQFIFYPRLDFRDMAGAENAGLISVGNGISISYSFYSGDQKYPNILFFHGNGEIASDYQAIGPIYNEIGLNLFVADYRGYGRSGGKPTLGSMIKDAHPIFDGFKQILGKGGFSGSLFIMGRSLGSASAIELASHYQNEFAGLIIESGFANVYNLLKYLGFPLKSLGVDVPVEPHSLELIRKISIPALVMHGEYDQIVPVEEGKSLYETIGSKDKSMVIITGVDHNTIMSGGMQQYLSALSNFVSAYNK
ncbi:MAG TPA: alpha/beta hydrolase [Dehalococcoidia bacterium]|jgi:alpha-beta hydrolase superfamily lysophospholipase